MRFLLIALVVATSFAPVASAAALCEFAAFTPSALQYRITAALASRGIAAVPTRLFSVPSDGNELTIVGNGRFYGSLRANRTLAGANTSLLVEDAEGSLLALVGTDTYACQGGWCRSMDLTTVLDHDSPPTVEKPALQMFQEPTYGMRYVVYGEEVGVTSWRTQYRDRLDWMVEALSDEAAAVPFTALSGNELLLVSLASDPDVAPYLGQIRFNVDSRGRVTFIGRMPHGVYDAIIDAAFRAGFYNIDPDVIIDSGSYLVPTSSDPDLQRCFGW